MRWHIAMKPGRSRKLDLSDRVDSIFDQIERLKAGIRAKVERPFRILKRQFGYTKRGTGAGKEHSADHDAIRDEQPVDGPRGLAERAKPAEDDTAKHITRETVTILTNDRDAWTFPPLTAHW